MRIPARAAMLGPAWPAGRAMVRLVKPRCYTARRFSRPARPRGLRAPSIGSMRQHHRLGRGARDAVLAAALGRVHRSVCADEQRVRRPTVGGVGDDADRDRRRRVDARHALLGDRQADLLGEHPATRRVRLGQQRHELVAAVAGRDVDLANAAADGVGDAPQDLVAGDVAEAVVDRLQVVEIQHDQAERPAGPVAARDLALEGREEEGPVVQAGERVHGRHPDRRVARPALLAPDRHADVRQQVQAGQVDQHLHERARARSLVDRQAGAEVRRGREDREDQRDPRRHEQGAGARR